MPEIELDYLTDDENERRLARDYWEQGENGKFVHTVASLAETFGASVRDIPAIVAAACLAYRTDEVCAECGEVCALPSRSAFMERRASKVDAAWVCDSCKAALRKEAREKAEELQARRVATLQSIFEGACRDAVTVEEMSLTQLTYLIALIRIGSDEKLTFVFPRKYYRSRLTPSDDFDLVALKHLYQSGLISVHPGSEPSSLVFKEGRFVEFTVPDVHWQLTRANDGSSTSRYLEELEAQIKKVARLPVSEDECVVLRTEIALSECLEFLTSEMVEMGFDFSPGEKTRQVLRSALSEFSTGQVFNFAWRASRDAAAFFLRAAQSMQHAMNNVPGSIQRMVERALADNHEVRSFTRSAKLPQTAVSQVLLTFALVLPEGGMHTIPGKHLP